MLLLVLDMLLDLLMCIPMGKPMVLVLDPLDSSGIRPCIWAWVSISYTYKRCWIAANGSCCVGDGLSFKFHLRIAWMFYEYS